MAWVLPQSGSPPQIHLIGFETSNEALKATEKCLSFFPEKLDLTFEFHAVANKVENLDP